MKAKSSLPKSSMKEMDVYLQYQGLTLGASCQFSRTVGLTPDSGSLAFPLGAKKVSKKTKPQEEKAGKKEPEKVLTLFGDLVFGDRAGLAREAASKVTLPGILISGDGVTAKEVFLEEGEIELAKVSVTDHRCLWKDCGVIQGDRNCIAKPEKEPFVLIDKIFYRASTLHPGAFPGSIRTPNESERRALGRQFNMRQGFLYQFVELPKRVKKSPLKTPVTKKLLWDPGQGFRWTAYELIMECLLHLFGVTGFWFWPQARKRLEDAYPVDLRWGGGEKASAALGTLLKHYGLQVSIRTTDPGIVDVFLPNEGQHKPEVLTSHLSKREMGVKFQIPPDAIFVTGAPDRFEVVCSDYFYVMEDLEGKIRAQEQILAEWGMDELAVARAVQQAEEADAFKTFFKGTSKAQKEKDNKKKALLKKCAFKWIRLSPVYDELGPLQKLLDLSNPQQLTEKEIEVGATIFIPKDSKAHLNEGVWACQYFYDAMSYVSSIDKKEHIVKFSEPMLLVIPGKGEAPVRYKGAEETYKRWWKETRKKIARIKKSLKGYESWKDIERKTYKKVIEEAKLLVTSREEYREKMLKQSTPPDEPEAPSRIEPPQTRLEKLGESAKRIGRGFMGQPKAVKRAIKTFNEDMERGLQTIRSVWIRIGEGGIWIAEKAGAGASWAVGKGGAPWLSGIADDWKHISREEEFTEEERKTRWVASMTFQIRKAKYLLKNHEIALAKALAAHDKKMAQLNKELDETNKILRNIEECASLPGLFSIKFSAVLPLHEGTHFQVLVGPEDSHPARTALLKTQLFSYTAIGGLSNEPALKKEAERLAQRYMENLNLVGKGTYTLRGFHPIDCGPMISRVTWRAENGIPTTTVEVNGGKTKLVSPLPLYKGLVK